MPGSLNIDPLIVDDKDKNTMVFFQVERTVCSCRYINTGQKDGELNIHL